MLDLYQRIYKDFLPFCSLSFHFFLESQRLLIFNKLILTISPLVAFVPLAIFKQCSFTLYYARFDLFQVPPIDSK